MSFPSALDTWANMTNQTLLLQDHLGRHNDLQTAIIGLETKVGITSSAVQTTHDYKLSGVALGDKAASKTGAETLTNKTLTTPVVAQISNTGTLTLPTTTDTLVGRATTDTLTNKTLTSPVFSAGAVGPTAIGLVDNSGTAVNLGQIGGVGNFWRFQFGSVAFFADGSNGFCNFSLPVALTTTTGAIVVATIVGDTYSGYVSECSMVDVLTARIRCAGITSGTVQIMVWGKCAS